MREIYLDNNASTQVNPEVRNEMLPLLEDEFGNPSSQHISGKKAKEVMETARGRVADLLGCSAGNIIFTSGGTESNNLAIQGFAKKLKEHKHFITSSVEHPSVMNAFKTLEEQGHRVSYLPVDSEGRINLEQLESIINEDTVLISIMLANNETGVIFPVSEIAQIAHKHHIPVHCDAVQGIGKLCVRVDALQADMLTLSAHKLHGPKGSGALYIRDMDMIEAVMPGGGQENGKRGGTEALPSIAGMGMACKLVIQNLGASIKKMSGLRDYFESEILKSIPGSAVNGSASPRICNTSNIRFSGNYRELLNKLSEAGVYASHGSACSSNKAKHSHVLAAMGLTPEEVNSSIRFSLSRETTRDDVEEALEIIRDLAKRPSGKSTCRACAVSASENEEKYSYSSSLRKGLEELWTISKGDPRICIAVLDGPVDLSHPCFEGARLKTVQTLAASHADIDTASSHGTHVTSIVFGQHHSPIQGIVPDCSGIVVPIFSSVPGESIQRCSQLDLARAINQAVNEGANIINISGGQLSSCGESDDYLTRAVKLCAEKGVLLVAAAGNDGCECLHVPAAMPSVLAVGATDSSGIPLPSSNWGKAYKQQGILAPGENILGALPGGETGLKTGTSFSTPFVTGLIGLLMSLSLKNGYKLDPFTIKDILLETAYPCEESGQVECKRFLAGKLNIEGVLERIHKLTDDDKNNKHQNNNQEKGRLANMNYEENNVPTISMVVSEEQVKASEVPAQAAAQEQPLQSSKSVNLSSVCSSGCGEHAAAQKAYVIGSLGFDFGSEARRDYFIQMGVKNPYNPAELLEYLNKHPEQSNTIIWTLNQDETPIYAVNPHGAYAHEGYTTILSFLKAQVEEGAERVSMSGLISSKFTLLNGHVVPGLFLPDLRGMYCWSTNSLLDANLEKTCNTKEYEEKKQGIRDFLTRLYYEVRNLGVTSQERAINYTATNIYQVEQVFSNAIKCNLSMEGITAEKSVICRPGSDCWDIRLTFFNPAKRFEVARKAFRFTVDVSDIVPVSVGEMRSWDIY